MDAEVDRHEILLLEHDVLLARVGRVMGNLVVEADPGGEPHAGLETVAGFQTVVAQERSHAVFEPVRDVHQFVAGLDGPLDPLPGLAMHLGGLAVILKKHTVVRVSKSVVACFTRRRRPGSLGVQLDFALEVVAVGEEVAEWDSWRRRLFRRRRGCRAVLVVLLPFPGLGLLSFLGCIGWGTFSRQWRF